MAEEATPPRRKSLDPVVETLLEEELSASETYRQAAEDARGEPCVVELRRIESDHRQAAAVLRERSRGRSGAVAGAWSACSRAIGYAAATGGCESAVRALIAGEERSVEEYERVLESDRLDDGLKRVIASVLLPQARAHIPTLARYLRRS